MPIPANLYAQTHPSSHHQPFAHFMTYAPYPLYAVPPLCTPHPNPITIPKIFFRKARQIEYALVYRLVTTNISYYQN